MTGKLKEPSLSKIQAIFWIKKKKGKEIRNDYKKKNSLQEPLLFTDLFIVLDCNYITFSETGKWPECIF